MEKELLFYDIEVFKYNSLVVFKDAQKNIKRIFHNNFTRLAEFIEGKILVGFNNYHYDDKILTFMLELKPQYLIKRLNDEIIEGKNVSYIGKPRFESLDVNQQIDISRPSLKRIEGNMGRMILESSVPFTIERPLTEDELNETIFYCGYDVDSTIDIYKIREKSYFMPKQMLLDMLGNQKASRWNTTTISANLLLNKPLQHWSDIRLPNKDLMFYVPEAVADMWRAKSKDNYIKSIVSETPKSMTIEAFDNEIQFGFGGLHGAHKKIKKARNVKLLDVASMYPNIILILNVLGEASGKYKEILERRLAIKHKDKILSDALKLLLNSVFGNLNNEYSLLCNPNALLSVCVYGQIALFELCKRIAPFATILNINTDGIAFIPNDDNYIGAYKDWEEEFKFQLEEKNFDLLVQKDVNNYVAVKGDKFVCKGGDVNRFEEDAFFKNNNARILDLCLVNKLVHDIDIDETLERNLDKPHLYQYILNTSNKYAGTFDAAGKQYNKVNRIFASVDAGFCLFKKRFDGGYVKYSDSPENMFLHNGDCNEIDDFEGKIDLNHYYNIVNKRMERWI